jgi:hypothetical protein
MLLDTRTSLVSIWYIPVGLDLKEGVLTEVLVGVGLMFWVVVVLLGTGVEGW